MKYKEYIKKNEKVIKPLDEILPILNILSIISMLGNEIGGEFGERVDEFTEIEKELLLNKELKKEEK